MTMFAIRSFIKGVQGNAAKTAEAIAVSHAAFYDSETGIVSIIKSMPWDQPIRKGKETLYIGDFQPSHAPALDYVFKLDQVHEAIEAYQEIVARDCFTLNLNEGSGLASDADPKDVIFVMGFKSSGNGADIQVSELVNQTHISILAICLFAKSIRASVEFIDALGVAANGLDDDDEDEDEDEDNDDVVDNSHGSTGLIMPCFSFGFGRLLS